VMQKMLNHYLKHPIISKKMVGKICVELNKKVGTFFNDSSNKQMANWKDMPKKTVSNYRKSDCCRTKSWKRTTFI